MQVAAPGLRDWAIAVIAIAVVYVGAYFADVEINSDGAEEIIHGAAKSRTWIVTTRYRVGGDAAAAFFRPMRTLDGWVRFPKDGHLADDGFVDFYSESLPEGED
jgi:hypothetical protein